MRSDKNVPVARKNVTYEAAAARSGQEDSAVVIEDSAASALKAAAGATPAYLRSVQGTGDVGSQHSTRGAGARQEEEDEVAVVALGLGGQGSAAMADAVAVADLGQACDDGMAKGEEMIKKLKAGNLALLEELIAEKTAHARALLKNVCLQRDTKKVLKEK